MGPTSCADLFGVPAVGPARGRPVERPAAATTAAGVVAGLPAGVPISGIAGDQQAALFGQACFARA